MKFPSYKKFTEMIPEEWRALIDPLLPADYYKKLHEFLRMEYTAGNVYPPADKIFRALELTPPDRIKAVILGQDPYHGSGEAEGLAFSVSGRSKLPPSLKNIFAEIESDTGLSLSGSGDLSPWAEQGVLLLNTILTVREDSPASHRKSGSEHNPGWEIFTDAVISAISSEMKNIVFLLWGNHAITKTELIDSKKHLVLTAPHPSPLSVNRGFKGCRHFSKVNKYLESRKKGKINWHC